VPDHVGHRLLDDAEGGQVDVGGQRVTAIITRDACRDLGLKKGQTAAALIKATEVMIIRPVGREL